MEILNLKDKIFEAGKEMGFDDMEISYVSNKKFNCKVFKDSIDDYSISIEGGISFRGVINNKMGYSYTEKVDETSINLLLKKARENAQVIENDDNEEIFEGSAIYERVDIFSDDYSHVKVEDKLQLLLNFAEEVYKQDERVAQILYNLYEDHESERMIFNTKGLSKIEKSNIGLIYFSILVKDSKDSKSSSILKVTRDFRDFDYKEMAKSVVEDALTLLGAEPVKSKDYSILLKNNAAASLLQTFKDIFSAENVQHGRSLLKNKLGEAIASNQITIIDDPHIKEKMASRSFDSEGVATKKCVIVEEGLLKTYLHNLKTAKKDGVSSTGHGYRNSYKGTITIAPTNLFIDSGDNTYDDLVKSIEEGLIITELQGLHSGANIVSGDFSLAAEGYFVKNGQIEKPVNQITIAGNFYELLKNIEAVGNDIEFTFPSEGYVGSPTLLIKKLAVSG
ncbi:TldD/PmbA family protein [Alkaliphilus peptidifermentans]|uniref:PmbA protein n=1 Tax=Alkaliphilus peptidifermentans DSM 18978 TaxID=1120976 RepID=A0A1G5HYB9_9FIRM|nr:TldD/PmbA family protein [Alkaliphilus peptidifermentans]SCY68855.1 PmbA protein [Alkaliphilus peptidifermentans DSM 18978]